jgi:regulatory protein
LAATSVDKQPRLRARAAANSIQLNVQSGKNSCRSYNLLFKLYNALMNSLEQTNVLPMPEESIELSRSSDEKPTGAKGKNKKNKGALRERPTKIYKPRDGSDLVESSREDIFKIVFTHAGKLISIKDWSNRSLAKRLAERFRLAPDINAIAEEVAKKMETIGALDDLRFARGLLRSKLTKSSLSSASRATMMAGVDKQTCEEALDELRAEGLVEEPADQAYKVWRKKFDHYPLDDRERSKQARFMASRGFSYDAISRVWSRVKQGIED